MTAKQKEIKENVTQHFSANIGKYIIGVMGLLITIGGGVIASWKSNVADQAIKTEKINTLENNQKAVWNNLNKKSDQEDVDNLSDAVKTLDGKIDQILFIQLGNRYDPTAYIVKKKKRNVKEYNVSGGGNGEASNLINKTNYK